MTEAEMDAEANAFALELLMPHELLLADVRKLGGIDISDDEAVAKLAKRYKVGTTVMALRLGQLLL